MKRIIRIFLIALVLAVSAYVTYCHFEGKAREKAERKAEQEKLRESTRVAINKMVSNFGAIDNWDEKLSKIVGEREIFTMELQNLWLTDRPILFMGKIEDVANNDDDQAAYSISIFYSLYNKFDFGSRLLLSLRCPKILLNSFFKEHPKGLSDANDVAVIAKINKVESYVQETEERDKKLVGIGLCLDIIELPVDVFP